MGQRSAIDQLPLTLHDLALLLDPPVVARKDLDEGTQGIGVIIDDLVADLRPRVKNVAIDQVAQQAHVLVILDRHEVDHLEIAPIAEAALGIIDEGVAAAHASGEVSAGPAQDDHNAAGHVLAGEVAHTLDDSLGAAVSNSEPLARPAPEKSLAAGRAVECDVAPDHVLAGGVNGLRRWRDDELPNREPLAGIVIG